MALYFAYGSNMNSARLVSRVGPIVIVGRHRLDGFRHRFNKHGTDGTAKGNIEECVGAVVWGAGYQISPSQMDKLETYEGGYRKAVIHVFGPGGTEANRLSATTFIAHRLREDLAPTDEYLSHYRLGAEEHRLPEDYLAEILDDLD